MNARLVVTDAGCTRHSLFLFFSFTHTATRVVVIARHLHNSTQSHTHTQLSSPSSIVLVRRNLPHASLQLFDPVPHLINLRDDRIAHRSKPFLHLFQHPTRRFLGRLLRRRTHTRTRRRLIHRRRFQSSSSETSRCPVHSSDSKTTRRKTHKFSERQQQRLNNQKKKNDGSRTRKYRIHSIPDGLRV
jgi:hypothetical protein